MAPVLNLAGEPDDPAFVALLESEELRLLLQRGMTAEEIERYRQNHGTELTQLASETMDKIRAELRAESRFFCLTSTAAFVALGRRNGMFVLRAAQKRR